MTFASIKDVVEAEWAGRLRITEWVKNVNQVTTAGIWYDLTGSSGNPKAKQWFDAAPLTAQQIKQSTDGGIYHGSDVASLGRQKVLRVVRVGCSTATPIPMEFILCDYLLYYPSVEDGTTDQQDMNNTLTLPRYATGAGVQMMAVTISSRTGGQSFTVSYTNSAGVAGRTTVAAVQNTAAAPGSITTSATNTQSGGHPFISLQEGDTGVRSIQSVTMLGADTGFFALVLVKPLATTSLFTTGTVYDKDLLLFANELPEIQDDAFLSLLALPQGSMSGAAVRGGLRTIWN